MPPGERRSLETSLAPGRYRARVVGEARHRSLDVLAKWEPPAGTEIVTGDMFVEVPTADAHVIKSVLHNWDDERAVAVLNCVRKAMPAHGRLFLVEPTLPADPAELPAAFTTLMSDLNMLVCTGGRERTAAEFAHLVRALIENDYMNAETIRFDGGIRFQPK